MNVSVVGGCAMCVMWNWFLLFVAYKMDVLYVTSYVSIFLPFLSRSCSWKEKVSLSVLFVKPLGLSRLTFTCGCGDFVIRD